MIEFSRQGLRFPVTDGGPADGEPVVLLHGFPQDATSWDRVAPLLHAGGLRTLALTQRGYASTARPRRRRDYRLGELVADVRALVDEVGAPVHLVGHDWGGGVAWAVADRHADVIRSLTVVSTPHPAATKTALLRSSQGVRSWYMGFFQLPAVPELTLAPILARSLRNSGLPADRADHYAAVTREDGALTAALNWYRGIPLDRVLTVGDVTVPTTYLWGRHDFALGRYAAEATEDHVTADYTFVPLDAGHWIPETHPADVADAILRRTSHTG
jgi:pimeloyl-ACP methyl ester carboxylesterase